MPVEVLGLDQIPLAGDELRVAPDDKTARTVAEARSHRRHTANLANPAILGGGARLEDVFAMVQRGEVATLNLVLKADVQGSLEALTGALRKLDQEHEEVRLSFVHSGVGGVNESDVDLASVANATVIGFNVRPDRKSRERAEFERVDLRLYEVIYQVLEDVSNALVGMLQPEFQEVVTGDAEVREVFSVPRIGKVAGCFVRNGVITRGSRVRFLREGVVIWNGAIESLRQVQGRRPRSPRGLRVRHRPLGLPGPEDRRRDRDLRDEGDRPRRAVIGILTDRVRPARHLDVVITTSRHPVRRVALMSQTPDAPTVESSRSSEFWEPRRPGTTLGRCAVPTGDWSLPRLSWGSPWRSRPDRVPSGLVRPSA